MTFSEDKCTKMNLALSYQQKLGITRLLMLQSKFLGNVILHYLDLSQNRYYTTLNATSLQNLKKYFDGHFDFLIRGDKLSLA